jgi:hypothetical protein
MGRKLYVQNIEQKFILLYHPSDSHLDKLVGYELIE